MIAKIPKARRKQEWLAQALSLSRDNDVAADDESGQLPGGLIMVQIDGLSKSQLEIAFSKGEMPFIQKMLSGGQYACHTLYSGLPSSTPAVQGELFYGVRGIVPAFGFRHDADGKLNRMYDPIVANRVQKRLQERGEPLLTGGSAYSNIYTGGAKESHFCAASMGWDDLLRGLKARNWFIVMLLNIPTLLRILGLMIIELGFAVVDMLRGVLSGKAIGAEIKFMAARVAVSILLRDLITIGASVDASRGLPIIHLNYLGYDEQSHRRGPQSKFAHWALKGIDRSIEKLWIAALRDGKRNYELWIYSDHGQEHTIPYEKLKGHSIDDAVRFSAEELAKQGVDFATRVKSTPAVTHAPLLKGIRRFDTTTTKNSESDASANHESFPMVVAMGPVGHIYFDGSQDIELLTDMANMLVTRYQVPAAVQITDNDKLLVHTARGIFTLPGQEVEVFGESHAFLSVISQDLLHLCKNDDAGDLILLGCVDGVPAISFPMENGAHAGAGPNETRAFAVLPNDTSVEESKDGFIRPLDIHKAALDKVALQNAVQAVEQAEPVQTVA